MTCDSSRFSFLAVLLLSLIAATVAQDSTLTDDVGETSTTFPGVTEAATATAQEMGGTVVVTTTSSRELTSNRGERTTLAIITGGESVETSPPTPVASSEDDLSTPRRTPTPSATPSAASTAPVGTMVPTTKPARTQKTEQQEDELAPRTTGPVLDSTTSAVDPDSEGDRGPVKTKSVSTQPSTQSSFTTERRASTTDTTEPSTTDDSRDVERTTVAATTTTRRTTTTRQLTATITSRDPSATGSPVPVLTPGPDGSPVPVTTPGPDGSPIPVYAPPGDDVAVQSDSKKSKRECFPGDAVVQLINGKRLRMSDLRAGDEILVGPNTYSTVFMFTHRLTAGNNDFVSLATKSGMEIRLTRGHFLYINGHLVTARDARVGDAVELADGSADTIASISMVKGRGLFNPQTLHGDIIVDGVRTSTYTTAVEPSVAHILLTPLRYAHRALTLSFKAVRKLTWRKQYVHFTPAVI